MSLIIPRNIAAALEPATVGARKERSDRWPDGKKMPLGGWDPYLHGLDLICDLGLMRPGHGYLLVRAIMPGEGRGSSLELVHGHTRDAIAYEVTAVGPGVHHHRVGDHIVHISAAADAVDPRAGEGARSRYLFVPAIGGEALGDVPGSWDPKLLAAVLEGSDGLDLDQLKERAEEVMREGAKAARAWEGKVKLPANSGDTPDF